MDCQIAQNSLIQYIEQKLEETDSKNLKEHLDICKKCSRLYNELEKTYYTIESNRIEETYPYFVNKVLKRIDEPDKLKVNVAFKQENFSFVFGRIAITGIAAVIILLVALYVLEGFLPNDIFTDFDYSSPDNVTSYLLSNI
jgi:predicted anti-sigma-YlaC factor YlaD